MRCRVSFVLGVGFLVVLLAVAAALAEDDPSVPAQIPFAETAIRDWRPEGESGLWLKGAKGRWYRATFMGSCLGLRHTESLRFDLLPNGTLDKTGGVFVEGRKCQFRSFMAQTGAPPTKQQMRAAAKAAREAPEAEAE